MLKGDQVQTGLRGFSRLLCTPLLIVLGYGRMSAASWGTKAGGVEA